MRTDRQQLILVPYCETLGSHLTKQIGDATVQPFNVGNFPFISKKMFFGKYP